MAEMFNVVARLMGDSSGMVSAFREAETAANALGRSVDRLAAQSAEADLASATWEKVGKVATLAGVIVAGVSIKMAADFDRSTNLLMTAGRETEQTIGAARDGILAIARATGTSAMDLSSGLYILNKAGYDVAHGGLEVLKNAAEGAKAENVDLATMTGALTDVMVNYGGSAKDSSQYTNGLIRASGLAKTTMQEFSGSLHSVVPIAAAAGISFAETAGAIDTMTQHGMSAEQAAQNLGHAITLLAKPTNVMSQEWGKMGLSALDVSSKLGERGLTGTLQLIHDTVVSHMGPDGTVLQSAFMNSAQAAQAMDTQIQNMPANLQGLAKSFMAGEIDRKTFLGDLGKMDETSSNLGRQFLATANKALGFNDLLKSGQPIAQTYIAEMNRMTGGLDAGRVAVMLLGGATETTANHSFKLFVNNVRDIQHAMDDTSGDILGWQSTSELLSTKMGQLGETLRSVAIGIGHDLMPAVSGAVDGFLGFYQGIKEGNPLLIGIAGVIGGVLSAAILGYVAKVVYAGVVTTVTTGTMAVQWTVAAARTAAGLAGMAAQALLSGQALENFIGYITTARGAMTIFAAGAAGVALALGQIEKQKGANQTLEDINNSVQSLSKADFSGIQKMFSPESWNLKFFEQVPADVNDLDSAIGRLVHEDGIDKFNESFDGLSKALGLGESGMQKVKDQFNAIGDSLANMVKNGQADQAAAAFTHLADSFVKQGGSIKTALESMPAYKDALTSLAEQTGVTRLSQDELAQLAEGVIPESMKRAAEGVQASKDAEKAAKDSTDALKKSLQDAGVGADGFVEDLGKLTSALIATSKVTFDAENADMAYQDSLDNVKKRLADAKAGFDHTTAAGRENEKAFLASASAGLADAEAMAKNGASQDQVQGQLSTTYNNLVTSATAFLGNKQAAEDFTRSLLHIPPGVSVESWMSGAARDMANQTQDAISRIDRNVQVNIHTSFTQSGTPVVDPGSYGGGAPVAVTNAHGGPIRHFAGGGFNGPVFGSGTYNSDSILTALSTGEFVQSTAAVSKYGMAMMRSINDLSYNPAVGAGTSGMRSVDSGYQYSRPSQQPGGGGDIYVTVEIPGIAEHFEGRIKSVSRQAAGSALSDLNRALRGAPGIRAGGL